ncbi:MAG: MarR family transcriptional regulator [Firmicutes bacterium]|nr:MarR family transcriptional regulator [Bacillota bacterium]
MDFKKEANSIVSSIRKINSIIHKNHHRIAKEHNLTLEQFHLLIHMPNDNNLTVGQIANRFNKAQNTMSEKVTRMEAKGLLKRINDKNDRRICRVIVTKKGKELIEKIKYKANNEFIQNALTEMDEGKVNELMKNLEKFSKIIDEKREV